MIKKLAFHLLYLKVARVFLQAEATGATQRGPTPLPLHPLGHERAEADEHEANEDRGQYHGDHDRYVSPVRACKSIGSLKNLFRMQVRWFWSGRMVMIISPLSISPKDIKHKIRHPYPLYRSNDDFVCTFGNKYECKIHSA